MQQYLSLVQQSALFKGLTEAETLQALACLKGTVSLYHKKDTLLQIDSISHSIGVILEGAVYLNKLNDYGTRQIFSELKAGQFFGENCLWSPEDPNSFEVAAAEDCQVLFIERDKILHPEKTTCPLRQRIIENLFHLLLANNQSLYQKMDLFSQKNLRGQILYYLQLQRRKNNSPTFEIAFSRQEFADYLGVDRSALSRELAKMQEEELLYYRRNSFTLLVH